MPTPSERAARPVRRSGGTPWTGLAFLVLAAVLGVCALVFDSARGAFAAQAAVWLVVGGVVLVARRRGR